MKKSLISLATLVLASLFSVSAMAKLPAPSDEAKAKAAEAAAKTAHGNKVADFQLCKSREKVAPTITRQPRPVANQLTRLLLHQLVQIQVPLWPLHRPLLLL